MRLRLLREPSKDGATLGVLFVNGVFQCWTLEDEIRDQKIPGETAIPAGVYDVKLTHSPRFGRVLPEIMNVPNFTGVRIHPLNRSSETEGCIGVGELRGDAWIGNSQIAMQKLMTKLLDAYSIRLAIENP